MLGLDGNVLIIIALAAVAAGALGYALLFSSIEQEKKLDTRLSRVKAAETDAAKIKVSRDRVQELSRRRKTMQDSLRDLEKAQKEKSGKIANKNLSARLMQTGLSITPARFYVFSALLGLFLFVVCFIGGLPPYAAVGGAFVGGVGLPRWVVGFLISRRNKKFLNEFPNALDVMVRSIKSGLPLNDALRLIASDGQEPVKTEFRRIVDAQQMGLSVGEACERMMITMPLSEVNFFAIVINLQAQSGGNLSEALSNLSRVLRDRKKMKAKVVALSMEAKASGAIIAALPFIVGLLVYFTSPNYIMILFNHPTGNMILLFSGIWMSIGVYVMRNMCSFEI